MPQLDIAKMLATMMGSPDTPLIGWIMHFAIGIVLYGVAIVCWMRNFQGQARSAM
ncbi:MAG: hypothetical protein ABI656_07685 [bacterium]